MSSSERVARHRAENARVDAMAYEQRAALFEPLRAATPSLRVGIGTDGAHRHDDRLLVVFGELKSKRDRLMRDFRA